MEKIPITDIVKKYRLEYSRLRPVQSSAIGDKVYFNMFGFNT